MAGAGVHSVIWAIKTVELYAAIDDMNARNL